MGTQDELAELRTAAARLREQAAAVTREMHEVRDALRSERERLHRERLEEERRSTEVRWRGELPPERAAVALRVERGETTWRDVVSGRDEHSSARAFRTVFAHEVEVAVQDLRDNDPEFRAEHDDALLRAGAQEES
ncbi:hypothetical protein BKA08_000412 [Nocardioides marinisabuli]|uniref:Uncharacterized protein n=1 Tax=Nocardioides marinisabuli TaxID=419476 RepID=A0A7Y9EYB6_9ACTN|nr:hypothetical protein [Nocardioides marinisabuli]NYD56174.1 hypothetical protein [Nocardioides marinisabuli]